MPWYEWEGKGQEIDGEVDGVDPWDFFQWTRWRMLGFYVKQTGWETEYFCYHDKELIFHFSTVPAGSAMRTFSKIGMCSSLLEMLLPNDI